MERNVPNQPRAVVDEVFAEAEINRDIRCEDTLDAVKSLPEFLGNKKIEYLLLRRVVHVAYKIFEPFIGSVKHYQAKQVQLKVSANTNKTLLSYEPIFVAQLNNKFRRDALRVFASGLKKLISVSDTLFSVPAALAAPQ